MTRAADLMLEVEACASRLRGHLFQLEQLGILFGMFRIGEWQPPLGLANIRRLRDGLWDHDPTGELAMIVPVCSPVIIEPWKAIEVDTIECVDLIAFTSRAPDRWAWRTGNAWALGEHLIEDGEEPLRLACTPLAWLRSGGEAACILDWSDTSPAWPLLRAAGRLVAEDPELKRRIDHMLRRTLRLPRVEVGHAA